MSYALKKIVTGAFSALILNASPLLAHEMDDAKFQAVMKKILRSSDFKSLPIEEESESYSCETGKNIVPQDSHHSKNEPDAIQFRIPAQEKKVAMGDRVDVKEAPTTSLHWFKMADKKHNHEDVIQFREGKVVYTHIQLAACHLNAAYTLLEEDGSQKLLDPLQEIIQMFAEADYLPKNFQRFTDFRYDISSEESRSHLYKLSPAVYHLMKCTDHLYAKRRLSLIKQRVCQLPRLEREEMLNSIDTDYSLSCEVWNFLRNNLTDEHYSDYRKKQAELSAKFLMPFRSDVIQIRVQ